MSVPACLDLGKFAKVCGYLSSPHPGERSAAAFRASAMLQAAGLTWAELLGCLGPNVVDDDDDDLPTRAELTQALLSGKLTAWETHFVRDVIAQDLQDLSEKQRRIIGQIMAKVRP